MRILIVDDESVERRGILMLIKRMDIPLETEEAANGEDAIRRLRQDRFDILLTDIRMPFMDGLSLAHEARKIDPDLYIIILTAYADFRNAQQAIRENVFRFLLKPVDIIEFNQIMSEAIGRIEEGRLACERRSKLEQEVLRYRQKEALRQKKPDAPDEASSDDADAACSRAVALVLDLIHSEYSKQLSLGSIADKVYLSPAYLSTLFRRETGETFIRYLNHYRLDRAAELLVNTNRPVGAICRDVGYTGQSYFCLQFRDRFGCSPQQYRLSHSGGEGEP